MEKIININKCNKKKMNKCTIKPEAFSQFLLEILWLGLRILERSVKKFIVIWKSV